MQVQPLVYLILKGLQQLRLHSDVGNNDLWLKQSVSDLQVARVNDTTWFPKVNVYNVFTLKDDKMKSEFCLD